MYTGETTENETVGSVITVLHSQYFHLIVHIFVQLIHLPVTFFVLQVTVCPIACRQCFANKKKKNQTK